MPLSFCLQSPVNPQGEATVAMLEHIEFMRWSGEEVVLSITDIYPGGDYIPVGTIEFTHAAMRAAGKEPPTPLNVPQALWADRAVRLHGYEYEGPYAHMLGPSKRGGTWSKTKYTGRRMALMAGSWKHVALHNHDKGTLHVKSHDKIKGDIKTSEILQVSDIVDFRAEWRCFVWRGELLDVRCYLGDFRLAPDYGVIEEMIEVFTDAPCAYTLDVGVISTGETVVVEAHDFYSCGLYGFRDHHLPLMYAGWWKEFLRAPEKKLSDQWTN